MMNWKAFEIKHSWLNKVKGNAIPVQAVETHRVVRRRGSHILQTIGSQTAVRLSVLRAGRPLHPGRFLVLISVRG
jgi:hypothetical protein